MFRRSIAAIGSSHKRKRPAEMPAVSLSMRVSRIPAGAGIHCRAIVFCSVSLPSRVSRSVSTSRTRHTGPVALSYNLARTFYASTPWLSTIVGCKYGFRSCRERFRGDRACGAAAPSHAETVVGSVGTRALASRIRVVPATDARNPKELREREAGDQRAATNAGCEEDQFFGNDLHSNSWRGRDEGGGTSSLV